MQRRTAPEEVEALLVLTDEERRRRVLAGNYAGLQLPRRFTP